MGSVDDNNSFSRFKKMVQNLSFPKVKTYHNYKTSQYIWLSIVYFKGLGHLQVLWKFQKDTSCSFGEKWESLFRFWPKTHSREIAFEVYHTVSKALHQVLSYKKHQIFTEVLQCPSSNASEYPFFLFLMVFLLPWPSPHSSPLHNIFFSDLSFYMRLGSAVQAQHPVAAGRPLLF